VRDQPQPIGDPYRVLGLEQGASMADVKRAYRRLAKAYHPDSAGEAALPRFLAIHEAYERLVSGRSRGSAGSRATSASSNAAPSAEPWRADPERARAARERARTGRASTGTRSHAGGGTASGGSAGTGSSSGSRSRSGTTGSPAGAGGAKGSTRSGSGPREGRRRNVRKATLGSTSYDEARDATDATWSGASWYGPSSGEYWIVNPREYADPRKHGPGYQQRARKAAAVGQAGTGTTGTVESGDATDIGEADEPPLPGASGDETAFADAASARDPRRWTGSARPAWTAAPEDQADIAAGVRREARRDLPGDGRPRDPIESLEAVGRDLLGGPTDDPIRRLGLALVAWPPLGLAAASAIGGMTGCTSYSAECAGADTILPWLAQAAILGLLLLLPPLARLFVGGTIAVLIALVPVTAFLLVVGAGAAPQSAFALGALLAAAWLGGVAFAARSGTRRASASPGGVGE
jgi:curved DNA-binding protein CbpA